MKTLLPIVLLVTLFAASGFSELPKAPRSETGQFYVSVDDAATLFLNGKEVFVAAFGDSKSDEFTLTEGDHLVLKLRDDGGERRFIMAFLSSDQKHLVNFKPGDFRIIPDIGLTTFTAAQFKDWNSRAKSLKQSGAKALPIKSYSRSLWGDLSTSTLACILTPEMFSAVPK